MNSQLNVLFVTADQFRGDCLSAAGHPVVRTPEPRPARRRRRLVPPPLRQRGAVRAEPGRPLHRHVPVQPPGGDQRLPARRPLHERRPRGPGARLRTRAVRLHRHRRRPPHGRPPTIRACCSYEGVLPGFDPVCHLPEGDPQRVARLAGRGAATTIPDGLARVRRPARAEGTQWRTQYAPSTRRPRSSPTASSTSSTTTARHAVVRAPLVSAAASAVPRARAVRHDVRPRVGARPRCARRRAPRKRAQHPLLGVMIDHPFIKSPDDDAGAARVPGDLLRDDDRGRRRSSAASSTTSTRPARPTHTIVVITSDHGELLGDHWLVQKIGWFDTAFHVPLIIRDPRAAVRRDARHDGEQRSPSTSTCTPTICDLLGTDVPLQCDGRPLTPCLEGATPIDWRHEVHHEFDLRDPDSRLLEDSVRRHDGGVLVRGAPRRPRQVRAVLRPPRVPADLLRHRQRSRAARRTSPPIPRTRRRCSTTRSACSPGACATPNARSPA